jgi:glycosyltransferase involved in cell wall biosynthesis
MATAREKSVLLLAGRLEVRGRTSQLLHLARRLPEAGFKTQILCPDASRLGKEVTQGITVHEAPALEWPLVRRAAWYWESWEQAENPPDLIHVYQRRMLPLGSFLAHKLRRPYVVTFHDFLRPGESLRFNQVLCRRYLAVSEPIRDELFATPRYPQELIEVIHSGVETEFPNEPPPILTQQKAPVIGTAGPLEFDKGHDVFVRSIPLILQACPGTQFVIAGTGPEEHNLRQLARELRVSEFVTFVCGMADLSVAIEAMDIFVLPSLRQGLGTIMLEAMARCRPVIATQAGGVYRVVREGETGLLVPPSDNAALARSVIDLLHDPEKARQLGLAGREQVCREFRVEDMVRKTAEMYRAVLSEMPTAKEMDA